MIGHTARILRNGVEARIGPYASREILLEAMSKFLDERASATLFADLWRIGKGVAGTIGVITLQEEDVEFGDFINQDYTAEISQEEVTAREEANEHLGKQ